LNNYSGIARAKFFSPEMEPAAAEGAAVAIGAGHRTLSN